jgi:hypothetical protein
MSNSSHTHQEEMDLTDVFSLIKRGFYRIAALFFRAFEFLLKFWWAVLILVISGIILGYVSMGEPGYKSTLVIQTNFETQPYVYNAIDQFNLNLKERDSAFMNQVGLNPNDPGVYKVMITPVIDVINLLENIKTGDRNLETVISQLNEEDDTELFATDRFYSSYRYHKLTLELSPRAGSKEINALMDYINNMPLIKKLSTEAQKNRIDHIAKNERTLEQMDAVVEAFIITSEVANKNSSNLSFYNNSSNVDLRELFVQKSELIIETEELKNELVTMEDAAVIVSDVQTSIDEDILDKKYIMYPIILVLLFMLTAGIIYMYRNMKRTLQREQLLD